MISAQKINKLCDILQMALLAFWLFSTCIAQVFSHVHKMLKYTIESLKILSVKAAMDTSVICIPGV